MVPLLIQTTRTERRNVVSGPSKASKEEYKDDTAQQARQMGNAPAAAPKEQKEGRKEPVHRDMPKVGRNDPCPCGSGKKYKNCCGRNE